MPDGFFSFRELDRRRVSIILERSLQDLVDRRAPITAIQFRLACRGPAGVRLHWKSYLYKNQIIITDLETETYFHFI